MLFQNIYTELSTYTAQNPKRADLKIELHFKWLQQK